MIYRNSWIPGGNLLGGKEIYVVFLFSLLVFLILLDFNKILKVNININIKYFYILMLLFVLFVSLITNSINEFKSLYKIVRFYIFFFYVFLYLYYIPSLIIRKHEFFNYLIKFYTVLGLIIGTVGIIMYFAKIVPISTYTNQTRYLSFIIHPNYVSFLLTITSVTSLFYYLYYGKNKRQFFKILIIITIIIQLISQFFTLSRGGLLGTTFGIFFLLFFKFRKKVILIVPALFSVIIYLAIQVFRTKGIASTFARFLLMIPVYYMLKEQSIHTIFGYGITNSFDAYSSYRGLYEIIEAVNNPHNTFLSIFIMFGIVFAILLFFYFIYLVFKGSIYSLKAKENEEKMFYAFLTSNLIAVFLHGLFDSMLIMPEYFVMQFFLIILGLMIFYTRKKNKYTFS